MVVTGAARQRPLPDMQGIGGGVSPLLRKPIVYTVSISHTSSPAESKARLNADLTVIRNQLISGGKDEEQEIRQDPMEAYRKGKISLEKALSLIENPDEKIDTSDNPF